MTLPGFVPTPPQDLVDRVAVIERVVRRMQQNVAGATTAGSGITLATPAQLPSIIGGALSAGTGTAAARYDHAHTSALSAQQDVTITSPAANQLLLYNGAKWVNTSLLSSTAPAAIGTTAAAGTGATASRTDHVHTSTIANQGDATVSAPATNQALLYNGTKWANATVLSSTTPAAIAATAAVGTATTMARADHAHTSTLANQGDAAISAPATNQALVYNGTKWANTTYLSSSSPAAIGAAAAAGTGTTVSRADHVHTSTLANQGDVSITTPSNGQVLSYNSTSAKWVNTTGGSGSSTLAGDTDVSISSPANGQVLTYNSTTSKWVNKADAESGMFSRYNGTTTTLTAGAWVAVPFATRNEGSGTGITVGGTNTTFTLASGVWRVHAQLQMSFTSTGTGVYAALADVSMAGSPTVVYAQQGCAYISGQSNVCLAAEVRSTGSAVVVCSAWVDSGTAGTISLSTFLGQPRLTFNWSPL